MRKQCIAAVKTKGNKILGMVKRNFVDRSKETIMALCKVFLDHIWHIVYKYGLWNPCLVQAKFHYASLVADRSEAGRRPIADLLPRY